MTELLLIFLGAAAIDDMALLFVFDRPRNASQPGVDAFSVIAGFILIVAASLQVVAPGLMPLPLPVNQFLLAMAFMMTVVTTSLSKPLATASVAPYLLLLRRFLPLIVGNAAVLAYVLLGQTSSRKLGDVLILCLGLSVAFHATAILVAAMRERILVADLPRLMRGGPIALLTAAIMALAMMGFAGSLRW